MSAGCLRWMLGHETRTIRALSSRFNRQDVVSAFWRRAPFSTEAPLDTEQTPAPKKKKKAQASESISSVGRKIHHRQIQVISEAGEELGVMHRANVIRLMDERNLKLVLRSEDAEPPVYQLMSGKQIHEEQLKQREQKKTKATPVQVKELTFSPGISPHDLATKLKQVESWLEKRHHVRLTLRAAQREATPDLDKVLGSKVEQMEVLFGFVSKPHVVREGRAAMCVLRPPSKKELQQTEKEKTSESTDSEREASGSTAQ